MASRWEWEGAAFTAQPQQVVPGSTDPLAAEVVVALVHCRTYAELPVALESVAKQVLAPQAVLIIDVDGIAEERERLRRDWSDFEFRELPNRGYSGGANAAVSWARRDHPSAKYLLVLTPDVELGRDYLARAVAEMEANPEAALCTGKLLRSDGVTLDSAGIRLPRHGRPRDRGSGESDCGQFDRTEFVFGASGAALLLRLAAVDDLLLDGELFDEDFFMYHEDTDLSWRCGVLGWRVLYVHDAVARHERRWKSDTRFEIPVEIRRHSFKNHYLQLVKNLRATELLRDLPALLGWEILRLGYAVFRDPRILPAYAQAARLLPDAWGKRRTLTLRIEDRHESTLARPAAGVSATPCPTAGPIYISGLYKCGTSWLLACLNAHREVVGAREFDVVRAIQGKRGSLRLAPIEERWNRFFSGSSFCRAHESAISSLRAVPAHEALAGIRTALAVADPGAAKAEGSAPLGFENLEETEALQLINAVRNAEHPAELLQSFVEAVASKSPPGIRVVLKAANQIEMFGSLLELDPLAAKIAIVRDGRDAAISAQHYRRLMREQGAPWVQRGDDYWKLLRGWAARALAVRERADRGELYLIRYEDLSADFAGTLGPLLDWLGLDASPAQLEAIRLRTDFEAITGRARGQAAKDVRRKGAIQEWRGVLNERDRGRAWRIAGSALRRFGYTETGRIDPVPSGVPGSER